MLDLGSQGWRTGPHYLFDGEHGGHRIGDQSSLPDVQRIVGAPPAPLAPKQDLAHVLFARRPGRASFPSGTFPVARRASSDAEVNPGNGLGTGSQVFNYNAKIYTDQATPPAGSYLDSVVLDVGF
jgi:hypothetical protein